MKILITGAAGFIGFHLARRLLERADTVVGLDNLNDYYDPNLKKARLERLEPNDRFTFAKGHLHDQEFVEKIFARYSFDVVVNLAAQAGVRYSIENPRAYVDSNLVGFTNILECCRHSEVGHLVYASSSSVYGMNTKQPFSETDNVDHPISLYAATKKANELMAHTYSHLYRLPTTGLRFFTVYGPWGRPDMAYFLFAEAIREGRPIKVFNEGKMHRDFTYIDDIVEGIVRTIDSPPRPNTRWQGEDPDPATSTAPYRIYNIGSNNPVELNDFINAIETALGTKAKKEMLPIQPGDVTSTFADIDALETAIGYRPKTSLEEGIQNFSDWYKTYRDWPSE